MNIFSSSPRRTSQEKRTHAALVPAERRLAAANRFKAAQNDGETSAEGTFSSALMAALFALPVTAVIGLVLLLIVTAVAYSHPDPDCLSTPLALGAVGLTSLLGGLVAARRGRSRGLFCGLLSGLLFTLLLLGLSLFFGDEARTQLSSGFSAPMTWGLHIGVVLLELLGAKIGGHRPEKQKHGHHKRL